MEIVVMLFILIGGSIAFSAWKNRSTDTPLSVGSHSGPDTASSVRKCNKCGHAGEMKTWLSHYTVPKLITVAGFLAGYLPGLIFLVFYWGKYKCPSCGAIGKNEQVIGVQ